MALAAAPFAAQAETINLYGWQNHSWEFVDIDGGRSFDRIQSNAGNIGFAASVDTGMGGIKVNLQCEQFTYYNHFAGGTGWCNRNSKIGLSHPGFGEIMLATWLLPYNEGVAQWVDPFYDAGADSHTSIMGSVGANTIFYNTGDFDFQASASGPTTGFSGSEFNYAGGGYDTGFNRRQENIIQYWSPNWNGFVFRFAWTAGNRDESKVRGDHEVDPIIRSSSLAYTNGPIWLAVTWQDHEDWTAISVGEMEASDAESIRFAGRYIMDMGDGMSFQVSAMYEDLEYQFDRVSSIGAAMSAFGYSNFNTYGRGSLSDDLIDSYAIGDTVGDLNTDLRLTTAHLAAAVGDEDGRIVLSNANPALTSAVTMYNTAVDNVAAANMKIENAYNSNDLSAHEAAVKELQEATDALVGTDETMGAGQALVNTHYASLSDAEKDKVRTVLAPGVHNRRTFNGNVKIEREAWMISGKLKFGGPLDFRFSYMDADDLEVSCATCSGDWGETAADAWNIGMFYTMPAGTELRLTYSEVSNDNNGTYGQGISGTGLGSPGGEVEMFALGIVHWFD